MDMKVTIDTMNLQLAVKISQVLADMLLDERIPLEIRLQYWKQVEPIVKETESKSHDK